MFRLTFQSLVRASPLAQVAPRIAFWTARSTGLLGGHKVRAVGLKNGSHMFLYSQRYRGVPRPHRGNHLLWFDQQLPFTPKMWLNHGPQRSKSPPWAPKGALRRSARRNLSKRRLALGGVSTKVPRPFLKCSFAKSN